MKTSKFILLAGLALGLAMVGSAFAKNGGPNRYLQYIPDTERNLTKADIPKTSTLSDGYLLHWRHIRHQGYERYYGVAYPPSGHFTPLPQGQKRSLLLSLHGHSGHPLRVAQVAKHHLLCEKAGCIAVYPAACKETSASGKICWAGRDARWQKSPRRGPQVDDPGFIRRVVDELLARPELNIDPEKVYIVGASNGGSATYFIACSGVYPFKEYASYMGNVQDYRCRLRKPVAFYHIHGDSDPVVPLRPKLEDAFAQRDGCKGPAQSLGTETIPGGMTVETFSYQACPKPYKLSIIKGGDHGLAPGQTHTFNVLLFREFFGLNPE